MIDVGTIAARLKNLFSLSEFQKRYSDDDGGAVQVKTHNAKVLEKAESFPYGFVTKAVAGRAIVLCQGGNYNDFVIMPVLKADDVTAPTLEEGDTAIYTANGGFIILREAGDIEVNARGEGKVSVVTEGGDISASATGSGKIIITSEDGKFYFGNGTNNMCKILVELIDEIKALQTAGSPPAHTVNPASQQKLEAYKNKVKQLYAESE